MQNTLFEQTTTQSNDQPAVHKFPTLYILDSKGRLRSWEIRVEGDDVNARIVSKAGLVGGAKVRNEIPVTGGRNLGRSNETTARSQAEMDARSKWEAQKRSGYCEDPAQAKKETLGSGIPAPMLAYIYSPDGTVRSSKTLDKMKIRGDRIHVQPKLDGVRCLALVNAEAVELYTRKGDRMQSVPHIERELRQSYDENFSNGVQLILDGELYTDAFTFNALNGLLRREDKSAEDFRRLEQVKYHLYDTMSEKHYETRYDVINLYFGRHLSVRTVPSYTITATDEEIRAKMEMFLSQGYEGLMIRRLDTPYENRRSWSLVKYKDFRDAEYRVVDIIEDQRGSGLIGAFELELESPVTDREGNRIRTFRAGVKDLTHEESRNLLAAKDSYIGRIATVEFFELSEYGIPRFGKLKGFRTDD